MIVGTVTYAFFNYTRTGGTNTISTGRIYFNSDYDDVMLNGIFPIDKSNVNTDSTNVMTVNVDVEGNTTYEYGLWYYITIESVNLTVNNKQVPVSFEVSASNIPGIDIRSYSHGYIVEDGDYFATGFIPKNVDVDGTLTIKAYLDNKYIAISDTYDGNESNNMGTTNGWVNNRVVLTTDEWNSLLSQNSLSFKVKVVSEEGQTPTDSSCFTTTTSGEEEGKIAITGYDVSCGGTDVVLPEKIDGKTVAAIKLGGLNNKGLTSLILNNGIERIVDGAVGNNSIKKIYIPNTVTTINGNGFLNNSLEEIYLTNGLNLSNNFGAGFIGNNIKSLYIPGTMENIDSSFKDNPQLSKLYISDGVKNIGNSLNPAFNNDQISKVFIPSSVELMYCNAFNNQFDNNSNLITTQIIYENDNFSCTAS